MRVLCIAAHPDDEVLGVGGTLLKHQAGGDDVLVALAHSCRVGSAEVDEAEARRRLDQYGGRVKAAVTTDGDATSAGRHPDGASD